MSTCTSSIQFQRDEWDLDLTLLISYLIQAMWKGFVVFMLQYWFCHVLSMCFIESVLQSWRALRTKHLLQLCHKDYGILFERPFGLLILCSKPFRLPLFHFHSPPADEHRFHRPIRHHWLQPWLLGCKDTSAAMSGFDTGTKIEHACWRIIHWASHYQTLAKVTLTWFFGWL